MKKNGTFVDTEAGYWNRAVIIVGVAENDKNGDGKPDVPTSELIERTQNKILEISIANNWGGIDKNGNCIEDETTVEEELCLMMTLTGPTPITNTLLFPACRRVTGETGF